LLGANDKPTLALKRDGVRYVELRSLDVNAFSPMGISEQQLRFLEALMLLCLLKDSPPISAQEKSEIDLNEMLTAHRGREPGLMLMQAGKQRSLMDWALELCDQMESVCKLLDHDIQGSPYTETLSFHRKLVLDPDKTPSARMLEEMRNNDEGFYQFARRMSQQHYRYFTGHKLSTERHAFFTQAAATSIQRQQQIEASDEITFDEFLRQYFAQS
jgi:glutamate--cysteine ligase